MPDRKPSHINLPNSWHPAAHLGVPSWKLNLLSSSYHTLEERNGNQTQHPHEQQKEELKQIGLH